MKTKQTSVLIASAALIAGSITALAQTTPAAPMPQAQARQQTEMNEAQKLHEEARTVETRLQQLAIEAEQQNPELIEQRSEFMELYESKLEDRGYPDQDAQLELQKKQQRLQNPEGMNEQERQQLTEEFQQEIMKMRQAEEQVRQDPEIQKEQGKLIEARSEAMAEINPEAPQLQEELEELYSKIAAASQPQVQPGR